MAGAREVDALVVGAGIAGLAAAATFAREGRETLLVEAGDAPGGVMRTTEMRDYTVEHGPNTFRATPRCVALLAEAGLEGRLQRATPASSARWLVRDAALVPVPLGPRALATTPLLSARGKLRMLAEPFLRAGPARGAEESESVADFVGRRLGAEVVEALVGPFLTGVYAGDEHELAAESVFPDLVDLEREHGSIVRGALVRALLRRGSAGPAGIFGYAGGLGALAAQLAAALSCEMRLDAPVRAIAREASGWRVELDAENVLARRLVLAVPAGAAAELLERSDAALAARLREIRSAPIACVALAVGARELRVPAEGFGFLVPRREELGLLGCLYMSQLFAGRAPEGRELLHCMLGGLRWPAAVHEPDDALVERASAELDRILGLRGAPERLVVERWPRAVVQPDRLHPARMRAAQRSLAALPGLALAGSYVAGVSVSDSLASGIDAAESLASA